MPGKYAQLNEATTEPVIESTEVSEKDLKYIKSSKEWEELSLCNCFFEIINEFSYSRAYL